MSKSDRIKPLHHSNQIVESFYNQEDYSEVYSISPLRHSFAMNNLKGALERDILSDAGLTVRNITRKLTGENTLSQPKAKVNYSVLKDQLESESNEEYLEVILEDPKPIYDRQGKMI